MISCVIQTFKIAVTTMCLCHATIAKIVPFNCDFKIGTKLRKPLGSS